MSKFWSPLVKDLVPYVPGEQPKLTKLVKLNTNENPYGPPESVMQAMTQAFKYANRYGYPDGNIVSEIAKHHGVKPENILLGAGSGEILDAAGESVSDDPLDWEPISPTAS